MDDSYRHPVDERKVKFKSNLLGERKQKNKWAFIITILSFLLSASLSFVSSKIMENSNNVIAIIVVFIIILVNILFDIVGTAVTAADEAPFHSMASRKLFGARQAIRLIRNADKVSNFCNDVVGDICGVISGAASTYIIINIAGSSGAAETSFLGLAISGSVAALTVGGKSLGKSIAIENGNYIIYKVGVILKFFSGRINLQKSKKRKK